MPVQERPPKKIGSLVADGPTPQPAMPAGGSLAAASPAPAATATASAAAPLMAHWAEPGAEHEGVAEAARSAAGGSTATGLSGKNPLAGKNFYVDPNTSAGRQAAAWRTTRPDDAAQLDKIANTPQATWLAGGEQNVEADVQNKVSAAKAQGTVPVFVAYNLPNRDVGQLSAGGVADTAAYKAWVDKVAAGIKGDPAVVILEPDALAQADSLPPAQREERYAMMRNAVATLKKAGATVYLDGGNPEWKKPEDMAERLKSAGVAGADGFALNVSNFFTTEANLAYGAALSAQVGGKHFVVDTSRNGVGPTPDRQWANPAGRALGTKPTSDTGNSLADAFLWIKRPGESDGAANGGLPAGTFMPEYALDLAKREPSAAQKESPASTGVGATSPAAQAHPLLRLQLSNLPPPK